MSRNPVKVWRGIPLRCSAGEIRSATGVARRTARMGGEATPTVSDAEERRFIAKALIWFAVLAVAPLILCHIVTLILPDLLRTSVIPNQAGAADMASRHEILITAEEHKRLEGLLSSEFAVAFSDKPYLQSLRDRLEMAKPVPSQEVPTDVVTMNSVVRVRELRSREAETYALVYPEEANIAAGKLSVLAPIGTAILGCRVGELVDWQVPQGTIRLHIEELIFQPERDGAVAT